MEKNPNTQVNQGQTGQGRGAIDVNHQNVPYAVQQLPRVPLGRGQPVQQMHMPQPPFPSTYPPQQFIQTNNAQPLHNSMLLQTINPGQPAYLQGQPQPYLRTNAGTGYLQTNAQPFLPGMSTRYFYLLDSCLSLLILLDFAFSCCLFSAWFPSFSLIVRPSAGESSTELRPDANHDPRQEHV
jgi:hypothetical protein